MDEYQAIYDENLKALTDKMDEWGISWSQVTGGGGSVQIGGGAGANMQSGGTSNANILASLYSILEQNLKDLEEAEDKYEDALTNAAFELQTLQLKLSSLQQAVTEAKEDYEIQLAQAKLTYETSLSGAERAESDYNTTVEKLSPIWQLWKVLMKMPKRIWNCLKAVWETDISMPLRMERSCGPWCGRSRL